MVDRLNNIIYHVSRYGLCNRLRCLSAMQALAELNSAELRMLWEPGITCPASFDELFEPVCRSISLEEIERLKHRADTKLVAGGATGNSPESYGKGEEFTLSWMEHARELRPVPRILRKVNEYQAAAWSDHMVGVHVRRTDAVADRGRRLGLTFNDGPIMEAMRQEIAAFPNTQFLFATDNQESLTVFQSEFGGRLCCYPKTFETFDPRKHSLFGASNAAGHRHTSMEYAVIDLWLLSRTKHIIGTKASSFSEQAAWIGSVPLRRL